MSNFQSRGFTVSYFKPLHEGGGWEGDLNVSLQDWRHSLDIFGGFDTAEFKLVDHLEQMENWMNFGLGRPIVVTDESLGIIWEGFVNRITWNQGGLKVTVGPVNELANKVVGVYSYIEPGQSPPEIGGRKRTSTQEDSESQDRWGTWSTVVSMAGLTTANAEQVISLYLAHHKNPQVTSDFSFTDTDPSLDIQCLGWFHSLTHPYNQTAITGQVALGQRISDIFLSQENAWISTDHSQIAENSTLVKSYQNDDELALSQLRGYVAMGDGEDNRYSLGVYENRTPVYARVESEIEYYVDIIDPHRRIIDSRGAVVPPWRVRPGRWMLFKDLLPGLGTVNPELGKDPRALLIEEVRFDIRLPYSVQLIGGSNNKFEQKIARLGLRGMDV